MEHTTAYLETVHLQIPYYDRIRSILNNNRMNPYIPIWGELYAIIWEIKKASRIQKKQIFLYKIDTADVIYDWIDDRIVIKTIDMNIRMKDFEYVNSLLEGRFI